MIAAADQQAVIPLGTEDDAGPDQTQPCPGAHGPPAGDPVRSAHADERDGTAKQLTRFPSAAGQVRVKGGRQSTNAILHPWRTAELDAILATVPPPTPIGDPAAHRQAWEGWREGLTAPVTLPDAVPRLRTLLVWDNLTGHLTPALVRWLFAQGIMPLDTPLRGSWLNVAESVQRGPKGTPTRRAVEGEYSQTPEEMIAWIEATARGGNRDPTPVVWGGKRRARA